MPDHTDQEDWLLTSDEARDLLRRRSPHLWVDNMTLLEVAHALGANEERPTCPHCGARCVVVLDEHDEEDRPVAPEMTHRCAACGKQLAMEDRLMPKVVPPCA
jgi:DNA-directed RNA polymerase subunit RPC12/RpoP